MNHPTRARRWALGLSVAAVVGAVSPTGVAAAADTVVVLASGAQVSPQGLDQGTEMSLDGGTTFQSPRAFAGVPDPAYALIQGTRWISTDRLGYEQLVAETLFRTTFSTPTDTRVAGTLAVCLHADNAAIVELDGRVVGAQQLEVTTANFQGQPECFTYEGRFAPGESELLFRVQNYGAAMGLDYRATVTYRPTPNVPPVLALPDDVVVTAPDGTGAVVDYAVTATDTDAWSEPTVACDVPSGSGFPVGATHVTCTATDDEGATSAGTFTVSVTGPPNEPPVLSLPAGVTVQAPGPEGAVVAFEATASDVDGTATVACDPQSGSTFPVGTTTVGCTATDDDGATATGEFAVTVLAPNQPPALTLPASETVDAVAPDGAPVTFEAAATDADGTATVACAPSSGDRFAIGTTTVTCTATDDVGAVTSGSFVVTVRGAREQLADFLVDLAGVSQTSTQAGMIRTVISWLPDRALPLACAPLRSIADRLAAGSGRWIPEDRAAGLIEDAQRIRAVLACR